MENKTAKREIDLNRCLKQAEIKWNNMPWTQAKREELKRFVETTKFEKVVERTPKEKSSIIDKIWLNGIIGSVLSWASLDWLTDWVIFLLPIGLYFLYKSFNAYSSLSQLPNPIPDQEALNKRNFKEEELKAAREAFCAMQKCNLLRQIEMFQIIFWQECLKQGLEGHISFQTKQDFIPNIGDIILAPPFKGSVINITHEIKEANFVSPSFIHFIQLESTQNNLADVFPLPREINFTPYKR